LSNQNKFLPLQPQTKEIGF